MILISCIARAELLGSTRLGDRLWPVRCDERCILYPFFDVVACLLCDVASKALLTWFRVQSESKGLDMWGLNSCHTLLYVRQSITHFCMLTSGFWVGMQQCTKYRQTSLHYNNQCCRVWMLPHCYEPPPPGDTEDWELQFTARSLSRNETSESGGGGRRRMSGLSALQAWWVRDSSGKFDALKVGWGWRCEWVSMEGCS